jgi:glycosyltransferase involved in cell wall biosynthesis
VKIAVVAHSHYPICQPFAGGLEAHTYHLVKQLQQAGHAVTLFAAAGSDPTLPYVPWFRPTAEELFNPNGWATAYRQVRYAALMNHLRGSDFDVVHNNSLHFVPLETVHHLPMPMVTVLHTPPFDSLVSGFATSLTAPNHTTIGVSKAAIHAWRQRLPMLQATLVYNGVDTQVWQPNGKAQSQAIWVGRITPEKGTHLAIAAAELTRMPLTICGPIHNRDYFEQQIKPCLNDRVTYAGCLDVLALAQAVAQARVFVCTPCWDEPFGLVVAEALASGTPVAGFERGALPEILTPETGVLVKETVEELAIAITQAQHLRHQTCRDRAVERFSLRAMTQRYLTLYRTVMANSHRPLSLPTAS